MLTDAQATFDSQTGLPVVSFRFNGQGAQKFGQATSQNVGKRFAIILDNKTVSAPVINGPITGGSGQITGNFTVESANQFAILLRAGALPAPLKVIEQRTVGAELGADAIRAGTISLAIGAVAIIVFIVLAYGLFGIFAALALIVNVLMILGIMSAFQATMTLPGVAGLILTLAVAVDANVLIYERVRDEAHAGRTPIMALEHGYSRALVSILDFALTLLIGVITSVFTAVVITQLLIGWWFRATKPKALPIE
jgi:preprotein translocase subunit SecD